MCPCPYSFSFPSQFSHLTLQLLLFFCPPQVSWMDLGICWSLGLKSLLHIQCIKSIQQTLLDLRKKSTKKKMCLEGMSFTLESRTGFLNLFFFLILLRFANAKRQKDIPQRAVYVSEIGIVRVFRSREEI